MYVVLSNFSPLLLLKRSNDREPVQRLFQLLKNRATRDGKKPLGLPGTTAEIFTGAHEYEEERDQRECHVPHRDATHDDHHQTASGCYQRQLRDLRKALVNVSEVLAESIEDSAYWRYVKPPRGAANNVGECVVVRSAATFDGKLTEKYAATNSQDGHGDENDEVNVRVEGVRVVSLLLLPPLAEPVVLNGHEALDYHK